MSPWLSFIRISFSLAIFAWICSAMFIKVGKNYLHPENRGLRVARWIFHELKPFYRFMAIARFGIHCLDLSPWLWIHAVVLGLDLWNYHLHKDSDDDDDRWKRRKAKTLEKVEVVSGRLAVTPT